MIVDPVHKQNKASQMNQIKINQYICNQLMALHYILQEKR